MVVDLRRELKVNQLRSLLPGAGLGHPLDREAVFPGMLGDQKMLVQALVQGHLTRCEGHNQVYSLRMSDYLNIIDAVCAQSHELRRWSEISGPISLQQAISGPYEYILARLVHLEAGHALQLLAAAGDLSTRPFSVVELVLLEDRVGVVQELDQRALGKAGWGSRGLVL